MFFCRDKDKNTAFVTREKECAIKRNKSICGRKALFGVSAPETGALSECRLQTEIIATRSESESLPGDHRFDADIKEIELIGAKEAQNEAILEEKYIIRMFCR